MRRRQDWLRITDVLGHTVDAILLLFSVHINS